jgi:hypothetical protein
MVNILENDEKRIESTKHLKHNVLLPTGDEQEYIPMLRYEGDVNEVDVIERALENDKKIPGKNVTTIYFMSPPGLGKTVMGAWIARKLNCPYQIINCVSTMSDLDLLGSFVLVGQETVWQDGPLPSIIRAANEHKVGVLIINELNALSLTAQVALNPLLDKQQCVVLMINNNELVRVAKDAHLLVLASMNPDILGVNALQDSVRDRANAVIYMDYPSPERESELVVKLTGVNKMAADIYAKIISECRLLKTRDHKITQAPSTRGLIDWINYSRCLSVKLAFELSIVNKYGTTEDERSALRIMGSGKGIDDIEPLFGENAIESDKKLATKKPKKSAIETAEEKRKIIPKTAAKPISKETVSKKPIPHPKPISKPISTVAKTPSTPAKSMPSKSKVPILKKVSDADAEQIVDLWKKKKSFVEISKLTGRSTSVVYRYIKKAQSRGVSREPEG